jgi:spermidine/putrescine transport system ATP-binding protein
MTDSGAVAATVQDMQRASTPEGDADIHLERVTKRFGETVAVDDLTLSIERGAFYAMLGPSGCGKTTTLRMIGGFEDPTDGRVFLGGSDVTELPPYRRDVNTVFQSYALFPHLSVEKNVAFGLERKKVGKDEVRRRVGETLELVQLEGLGKRKPGQLSGGQQQRVALARALVNHPRALLLDEPLGALDLKLRQQMQIELKRIQREVGITFVYVTHDQGEALTMSDRIAVMDAGVIEQLGTSREIYERPATRFVAGFIGTSNLISGRVDGVEGNRAVLSYGDDGRVIVPLPHAVGPGDAIEVSVRPEKIDLHHTQPPPTDASVLSGVVTEVVYHGTSTNYTVTTAAGPDFVVFDQNTSSADDLAERGDHVFLTWAPQHSYPIGA